MNQMRMNLEKCFLITIRRTKTYIDTMHTLGDHVIQRADEVRDLGLPIDCKMMFGAQIERTTSKTRQSLGYIGTITLKILYTSFVRSRLDFASVICDDIESVQKQFVMYALGDSNRVPPFRLAPYEERCKTLGQDTLSNRRRDINLLFAYDLFNYRTKTFRVN